MKVLARAILGLVLALLFWEGALRVLLIRPVAYHADPVWGWMPQPHSSGMQGSEGFASFSFNAHGFRGPEISPKAPGEIRILALGDSFTEGRQMSLPETFPRRLQVLLGNEKNCAGKNIRVFNGGRDGVSPAYSVYLAEPIQQLFQPDWVVLLSRDGDWAKTLSTQEEIFYAPQNDGFALQTNWQSQRHSRIRELATRTGLRHLALYNYAQARLTLLRGAENRDYDRAGTRNSAEIVRERAALAWTLDELQKRFRARLLVVHIPYGSTANGGLVAPSEIESELQKACRARGIPFIAMRERIAADFAQSRIAPYGFANTLPWTGHPNAHGHELVAQALDEFFAARLCQDKKDNR